MTAFLAVIGLICLVVLVVALLLDGAARERQQGGRR